MSASPPVLDQVLVRECLEFSRYLSSKGPGVSAKLEVKNAGNSFSFNIKTPPTEVQGRKKKRKAPSAVTGEEINEDDLVFLIPDPLDAAPLLLDPMDSGPLLLDPLDAALLLQDPLEAAPLLLEPLDAMPLLLDPLDATLLPQFLANPELVSIEGGTTTLFTLTRFVQVDGETGTPDYDSPLQPYNDQCPSPLSTART